MTDEVQEQQQSPGAPSSVVHRGLDLKPRGYYAAKHLWQSARISFNRRRLTPYQWSGVRVLAYHRVSDDQDELAVPIDRFEGHMRALAEADATVVDLDGALHLLNDGTVGRYVCLTFDDGYRDNLEHALPVLERFQIPAQIYLATAVIEGEARFDWYKEQPPLLSWDEVRDLARTPLISFGAQTRTHPILPRLDDASAWAEIEGSKLDLERQLDEPVTTFCYPGGLYGQREVELVERAGFALGLTCEPGVNTSEQGRASLLRTMIDRRDSLEDFRAKLAGLFDAPSALRTWVRRRRITE
jgi:peptidoglycan/xylan/chitin deacetylase (PgdA/CDA1 family)